MRLLLFISFVFLSLKSCGQTEEELEKEIAEQRSIWNNTLVHDTTASFNKKPNALLIETVKGIKRGKALDIGMGQGRNSIFLAKEGWDVMGIDVADEAVTFALETARTEQVTIYTNVIAMQQFDFGKNHWDLIVHLYEGCLDGDNNKFEKISQALKPSGLLVFEFFHKEAGPKMGMPNFGCDASTTKDLLEKSKQFEIIRYTEEEGIADFTLTKVKLVKLVARKK